MKEQIVHVIGAGLAGCEASYQLAKRGIFVKLYEMKPKKKSPAHSLDTFAELVCSNSFRSDSLENAAGILKAELRMLDSLVMKAASKYQVPAGSALAVDREGFSTYVTQLLQAHPLIEIVEEEVKTIPPGYVIIATGPLTAEDLFEDIKKLSGEESLYFFDAAAPIVEYDSIDFSIAYFKSRYDKGEATYINCPMTKDQYDHWYNELIHAQCVVPKDFEMKVFEGCMPFEEMAKRGKETLLFGPMKPVGLRLPDGTKPYAVVQLRQDNLQKTLFNIVGFQTHLTFSEQKRILRLIPGLEKVNIVRYGVMHKNTFVNGPRLLNSCYQMKEHPSIFIAGQLSGVDGYVESVGSGMVASINMARLLKNLPLIEFPRHSAIGAQAFYLANASPIDFQPMNVNFGLFPPLDEDAKKKERKSRYANRALQSIQEGLERGIFDE
ncbi:MAG: methylenetetrahydrofolate--tRNA-(uracil(54)-C(5))-methyltransferase (FADH(2)-oxidizing) TrmFO [Candidatus Izemoplasmatales bacterium]|nr:methylenetetrahydrofolate--tRNA-(uracil(54)-C(5))-methyltransferase (FADH(2)-oxidizing) TrmFO [Candidatus Izemoplasmatales bacterium]